MSRKQWAFALLVAFFISSFFGGCHASNPSCFDLWKADHTAEWDEELWEGQSCKCNEDSMSYGDYKNDPELAGKPCSEDEGERGSTAGESSSDQESGAESDSDSTGPMADESTGSTGPVADGGGSSSADGQEGSSSFSSSSSFGGIDDSTGETVCAWEGQGSVCLDLGSQAGCCSEMIACSQIAECGQILECTLVPAGLGYGECALRFDGGAAEDALSSCLGGDPHAQADCGLPPVPAPQGPAA